MKRFYVSSFISLVNLIVFDFTKFFSIHATHRTRRDNTHVVLRVPYVESLHDQVLQSNFSVRKIVKKIDFTASNPGDFESTSNFQRQP